MNASERAGADRDARRLAQSEFVHPVVLEAGAGTGKTAALVARVVAWALGPGWSRARDTLGHDADPERLAARTLERVVAITFTDAAAAEMAERVGTALAALERGETPVGVDLDLLPDPDLLPERARALLAQLDRLVVRTIHAWCRRLLATFPLDAGLHPAFEVDGDGRRLAEVVREVTETGVIDAYASRAVTALLELASDGHGPGDVESALLRLVEAGMPASALAEPALSPERVGPLLADVGGALTAFRRAEGGALERVPGQSALTHTLDAALAELAATLAATRPTVPSLSELAERTRELLPDNCVGRLRDWSRGKFNKSERPQLEPLGADFRLSCRGVRSRVFHLKALDPAKLERARRAIAPLLARVESELCARGIETYASLLEHARELLESSPQALARTRASIDQLLVDEFQDTDSVQCEIVSALALDEPAGTRPGLFVVGDPKQSIYGWRGADLAAYDDFVARVRDAGGSVRPLSVNFRSVPPVLHEVERAIAPSMLPESGVQPPFVPLVASPELEDAAGFVAGARRPVEVWLSWTPDPNGDLGSSSALRAAELEARELARDLRDLHDREGVAWRDVGVLFRSRGDLDLYVSELRAREIPHVVNGDRNYYRRREVVDAIALIRTVLDPNDHLSLIAWLRSPAVGIPDAAWIPLWQRRFPSLMSELCGPDRAALESIDALLRSVANEVSEGVPGIERVRGWERTAFSAVQVLAEARASFERDPADVFVERLRRHSWIEVTEAARYQGSYRIANLDRLFQRLALELDSSERGADSILRGLRSSVERGEEAEEARPKESAEDAVQILTIHQAKGLAFRHVYAMQLHKQSGGGDAPAAIAGRVNGRFEYELLRAPSLGFGALGERQRATASAEQVRTLYVAMTRARERLVLVGSPDPSRKRGVEEARSHAELLSCRLEAVGTDALEALQPGEHLDASHVRWRVLSHAEDPESGAGGAPSVVLPSLERVASDAELLRKRRERAADRMRRTLSRPASEDADRRTYEPEDVERSGLPGTRTAALATGTAIHELLEKLDLSAELKPALESGRGEVARELRASLDPELAERAIARANEVLDHLLEGPLVERLSKLAGHVVARELPILSPPRGSGDTDPVGFVAGAIDLVYREPDSGEWVVVDFKTDRVEDLDEPAADRSSRYRAQGDVYTRALEEALGLDVRPRFELWWLNAGQVEVVDPSG